MNGSLPDGWALSTLDEVSEVILGQSPSSETYNTNGKGLPFYQGKAEFGDLYPTTVKWCSVPKKIAEAGDILISVRAPVGPTNLCQEKSAIGRGLAALRPKSGMPSKYLLYYLRLIESEWDRKATGTTFKAITGDVLRNQEISVAPRPKQEWIVAKIEELFTQLEAGTFALERVRAGLRQYKASVLKAACEGQLFSKVELGDSGLPVDWQWIKVKEAGKVQLGRQRSPKHHQGKHMRPYLRVANVFEDRIDLSDVKEMNFTPAEYEIYKLEYGDILLNEGQSPEYLGRPAMYKGELPGGCFQNTLIRFQAFNFVDRLFALFVFRHYMHAGRFAQESQITTNMAHLSAGRFGNIEFPLPPLEEQRRIVAEVERRLSVAREVETTVEAALVRASRLRQAVLKSAFEGRL
jgi:type I restriction enzyme, S subunit